MDIRSKALAESEKVKSLRSMAGVLLLILTLFCIGFINFHLFHSASELLSIVIGVSIYVVSKNTYNFSKNGYLMFLGISFIFLSIFNLLHISYDATSAAASASTINISQQMEVISSIMQAIVFIVAYRYINRPIKPLTVIGCYIVITLLIALSVFYFNIFPVCYSQNSGPTIFNRVSNILAIVIIILATVILKLKEKEFNKEVFINLISSLIITIVSETFFIISTNELGAFNLLGHLMKLIAILLVYKAIIETNLTKPYKAMFSSLSEANEELERKTIELEEINIKLNIENEEFKIMQQALSDSKKNYLQLIDFLPYAIFTHRDGKILFLNNAAISLFRANDYADMIGRDVLDFVHPDDRKLSGVRMEKAYNGGDTELLERRMLDINGQVIYVETKSVPCIHKGLPAALVVAGDISERKRAEEKDKMLKEAIEYDRIKTEFFANISHELRTPLNVIFGAIQLMDLYAENGKMLENIHSIKRYLQNMKQNSYRMLRLINNLIDLTKIDSGYLKLNMQNHNIINIVEDITLSVAQYIESKGLNILFDTDVEEKIVACDVDVIERVILNLLSNAIKFTGEGGYIYVIVKDKEKFIEISVKDTGIGIPEDKLSIIFERFRQVDKSLARSNEGSGIGLSLVKSLVEMHGGKIKVYSEYGKGTEFIIDMPVYNLAEDEVAADYDMPQGNVERINIEFSDIYS